MKKFLTRAVSLVLVLFSCLCFTSCDKEESQRHPFYNFSIGYQVLVYPECEFNYVIEDEDCTIHINSISVTLTEKNIISENDTLSDIYNPFVYHISASATTDSKFSGRAIYLSLKDVESLGGLFPNSIIKEDGTIAWENNIQTNLIFPHLVFSGAEMD